MVKNGEWEEGYDISLQGICLNNECGTCPLSVHAGETHNPYRYLWKSIGKDPSDARRCHDNMDVIARYFGIEPDHSGFHDDDWVWVPRGTGYYDAQGDDRLVLGSIGAFMRYAAVQNKEECIAVQNGMMAYWGSMICVAIERKDGEWEFSSNAEVILSAKSADCFKPECIGQIWNTPNDLWVSGYRLDAPYDEPVYVDIV